MSLPTEKISEPGARPHDGLRLPSLGLGCWAFGGGAYWGRQDQADVDRVVGRALDLELNYFDTAESYNCGASESSLGEALRGRRSEAIIGSKVNPSHAYPSTLRHHCEQSLRRLGTDYLDLYMIHWPLNRPSVRHFTDNKRIVESPPALEPALQAMNELRREGKIRHVGLSNFGRGQLAEAVGCGVPIAAEELPYNLLMRAAEEEVLPFCAEQGIRTLGYSALMQGLLARPLASFDGVAPVRLRTRHFTPDREGSRHGESGIESETFAALQAIARIAAEAGRPLSEVALGWVMANQAISCTLVGCRNPGQLEENLKSLARPLAPEIKQRLDRATEEVKGRLGDRIDYFQGAHETRSW